MAYRRNEKSKPFPVFFSPNNWQTLHQKRAPKDTIKVQLAPCNITS